MKIEIEEKNENKVKRISEFEGNMI